MSAVSWLVGKFHVSVSFREIAFDMIKRMNKAGWKGREKRKAILREARECRKEDIDLYFSVMAGK